ncbi:MAG: hypothetical protein ABIH66_09375 [bacterium]
MYEYDTDLEEYTAVEPNTGSSLEPWKGYWIYIDKNLQEPCELTFSE